MNLVIDSYDLISGGIEFHILLQRIVLLLSDTGQYRISLKRLPWLNVLLQKYVLSDKDTLPNFMIIGAITTKVRWRPSCQIVFI